MWEQGLGAATGALMGLPPDGDWQHDLGLRGTVFPISEDERLYLGAKHTIPELPQQSGILIWRGFEGIVRTVVEEVRDLPGRPDVVVIRAGEGVPGIGGISLDAPGNVWSEVVTAGYPEDAVDARPEERMLSVRGLRGYITRSVDPGRLIGYAGHSYELSFAVPSGMSGAPLVVQADNAMLGGVIGVCVGSTDARTTEWEVERDGDGVARRNYRVVEFGVASLLHSNDVEPFTGKRLLEVMGWGPGMAQRFKGGPI